MSGFMLDLGRFTPLYGYVALARFPLTDGYLPVGGRDPLWLPVANVLAWTVIFALAGAVGRTPEPGAHVTATPLPDNPWEKWGWAFAVDLAGLPRLPDHRGPRLRRPAWRSRSARCWRIAWFAVANVLGYASGSSPGWALGAHARAGPARRCP